MATACVVFGYLWGIPDLRETLCLALRFFINKIPRRTTEQSDALLNSARTESLEDLALRSSGIIQHGPHFAQIPVTIADQLTAQIISL